MILSEILFIAVETASQMHEVGNKHLDSSLKNE